MLKSRDKWQLMMIVINKFWLSSTSANCHQQWWLMKPDDNWWLLMTIDGELTIDGGQSNEQ